MIGQTKICEDLRTLCKACGLTTLHALHEVAPEGVPRRFVITCMVCADERDLSTGTGDAIKAGNGMPAGEAAAEAAEDVPRAACPGCGVKLADLDGFGVLHHLKTEGGCGYCAHPSYTEEHCDVCGIWWGEPA